MNLMRLFLAITTLLLSFALMSCEDDKTGTTGEERASRDKGQAGQGSQGQGSQGQGSQGQGSQGQGGQAGGSDGDNERQEPPVTLVTGACKITASNPMQLVQGNPNPPNSITITCTTNITDAACDGIVDTATEQYRTNYNNGVDQGVLYVPKPFRDQVVQGLKAKLTDAHLPKKEFSANAKCPEPKRLASCTAGNVVTYAYDSGTPSLNTQLKNGLKVSCTAPNVYTDLSESSEN